jgi:hypothetical protein
MLKTNKKIYNLNKKNEQLTMNGQLPKEQLTGDKAGRAKTRRGFGLRFTRYIPNTSLSANGL